MLKLENHIQITPEVIADPNLCHRFSEIDLQSIGNCVHDGYLADKMSRRLWEKRTESAMDLAMQIQTEKSFPWPDCSNINFPLVTIAVLQFHARAYPALIDGPQIVKMRVNGPDARAEAFQRAERVENHMSWQILEQDQSWEEQMDRLLLNMAVIGCAFKKSYYNAEKGHNVSTFVQAKNLVLNYWGKSVDECPRKTEILYKSRSDLHSEILRGAYRDIREEGWYSSPITPTISEQSLREDRRAGESTPPTDYATPHCVLEQHVSLDLDGDGYDEPYTITIHESSRAVLRIVTRFDTESAVQRTSTGEIISIRPIEYYTKYGFIPSPDGGIYDIGLGMLTGPLNEAVNSLTNMLVDSGTMSNSAGGFLGRGMKIRGGVYTFSPFEWKRVDSSGDDLRQSIFPLPTREPSAVLLQLLSLLINYTNRISGSTDTMVGENPGQNTPAETSRTMIEQGSKIYSALFKRIWRSMKEEFKKLYLLNGVYLPAKQNFGAGSFILQEDYLGDPNAVIPVADPRVTSETQRLQQAIMLKQSAMTTPGYDREAVERRFLQASHVDGIDQIFPGMQKTGPLPNPKVQIEQMKLQAKMADIKFKTQKAVLEMQEEHLLNAAKITELEARAQKEIAEAGGVQTGQLIAAYEAAIGAMKAHNDSVAKQIELLMKGMEDGNRDQQGGVPGMAPAPGNTGVQEPSTPEPGGMQG